MWSERTAICNCTDEFSLCKIFYWGLTHKPHPVLICRSSLEPAFLEIMNYWRNILLFYLFFFSSHPVILSVAKSRTLSSSMRHSMCISKLLALSLVSESGNKNSWHQSFAQRLYISDSSIFLSLSTRNLSFIIKYMLKHEYKFLYRCDQIHLYFYFFLLFFTYYESHLFSRIK